MMKNETKEVRSNRALWNNLARVHIGSTFYNVPDFLRGKSSLNPIDLQVLGEVRGKTVLHLQCHFGLDTLSVARMGAKVTGVDFSDVAIKMAQELNDTLGLDAKFIVSDVNQLDMPLDATFDVVYASFGTIGWHSDLGKWARIVSRFMKKNGRFCFAEFHPVLWMLSDDHSTIGHSYFKSGPIVEEVKKSYAGTGSKKLGTSYCWNHSLSELFGALESQGLTIHNFKEYDYSPYRTFQDAVEQDGKYYIKGLEHMLPLAYSLTATKER